MGSYGVLAFSISNETRMKPKSCAAKIIGWLGFPLVVRYATVSNVQATAAYLCAAVHPLATCSHG